MPMLPYVPVRSLTPEPREPYRSGTEGPRNDSYAARKEYTLMIRESVERVRRYRPYLAYYTTRQVRRDGSWRQGDLIDAAWEKTKHLRQLDNTTPQPDDLARAEEYEQQWQEDDVRFEQLTEDRRVSIEARRARALAANKEWTPPGAPMAIQNEILEHDDIQRQWLLGPGPPSWFIPPTPLPRPTAQPIHAPVPVRADASAPDRPWWAAPPASPSPPPPPPPRAPPAETGSGWDMEDYMPGSAWGGGGGGWTRGGWGNGGWGNDNNTDPYDGAYGPAASAWRAYLVEPAPPVAPVLLPNFPDPYAEDYEPPEISSAGRPLTPYDEPGPLVQLTNADGTLTEPRPLVWTTRGYRHEYRYEMVNRAKGDYRVMQDRCQKGGSRCELHWPCGACFKHPAAPFFLLGETYWDAVWGEKPEQDVDAASGTEGGSLYDPDSPSSGADVPGPWSIPADEEEPEF